MRIDSINGNIKINGKSYKGNNVVIVGDKVIIDGVTQDAEIGQTVNIEIEGNVEKIENEVGDITVRGGAGTIKTASGDISCGDVGGSVSTMNGDVDCGNVGGSVSTMNGDISRR